MRTLLIFPPQAHFTQPYLALPSLTAYLKANGFPETRQWDMNLDSLEYFLSPSRLATSRTRIRERLDAFDTTRDLDLARMDEFKTLTEASVAADSVVGGIDDALATLRDPNRFYDYGQYLRAVKRLDKAFKLISAEWYPTVLSPNSFAMRWSIEREEDVLAAIADERENPYIEYFREVAIPRIARERPDLIGISITYGSMIIPAFTLARMIKEALPSAHITIGGGLLAYAGAKIAKSGAVFSVIDSIVLLEGEGPLLGIARAVAAGTDVAGVGNVIWKRDGVVVTNKTVEPLPIDALPTPDFDGLPLDRYVSPRIALPLAITRGCYYEKCVFCTLYKVIGPGYRQRNLAKILDDIEAVTTKYGSNAVYFVVEDMPPVLFRALPDALASRQLSIEWWTDARLEKNLYTPELTRRLYESGCRRIAFGFESASQRLLDLMDKGTAIAEASDIVKTVADAGIAVVLYTMIGFPSETEDEARATLAWIRAHQPWVQEVSLRIFYMDNLSQTYAHPERFGITRVHEDPTKQYQVYFDHDVSSGLTRAQARTIFFEFMEAVRAEFPLFKGDNLWLFELKSHHFLYLCRKGSLDVFQGRMTAHVPPPPPRDLLATKPRLAHDVVITDLPYDLGELTQTLVKAEDETLRPRYQSGSFKTEMFAQLNDVIPPVQPRASAIGWRGASSDFLRIGKDAATILRRLDGRSTLADVLARYDEAQRPAVTSFLRAAFSKGLVDDATPARTTREQEVSS